MLHIQMAALLLREEGHFVGVAGYNLNRWEVEETI